MKNSLPALFKQKYSDHKNIIPALGCKNTIMTSNVDNK